MADIEITCCDCRNGFIHSERDQEFYASQNPPFTPPKRCKPCRDIKKQQRSVQDAGKFAQRNSTPEPGRNGRRYRD